MNILCVRIGAFPEQYKRVLHIVCLNGGNQSEIKPFLVSETTDLPDKNPYKNNRQSQQERNTPLWIFVLHSNLWMKRIYSASGYVTTITLCRRRSQTGL